VEKCDEKEHFGTPEGRSPYGSNPEGVILSELIHLCIRESSSFASMEETCQYLGRFYLATRYPDAIIGSPPEGLPNENDAKKAIDESGKVLKFVKKILKVTKT